MLRNPVALKVLAVHSGLSAEARARFEREAHALGRLSHPNIVTLLDVGEEGQCCYLAMTLVNGVDLADCVRRRGPLTVADDNYWCCVADEIFFIVLL